MSPKRILSSLARNWIKAFVDPHRAFGIANLPRFIDNWRQYGRLAGSGIVQWTETYPCLTDWTTVTPFDSHYFYQASWAARKLVNLKASLHVDIGSSVLAIGLISAIVPTIFIDYRPLQAKLPGLISLAGDLLDLPLASGSVRSLSCLHVIEHIGLGRYGEPLDPQGSFKAVRELVRVLAPGGRLLISTPVGRERVQFNAHRISAPQSILMMFHECELIDFSMVDDQGIFRTGVHPNQASGCEYACGLFEFVRC